MPLVRISGFLCRSAMAIVLLLPGACSISQVSSNRYQSDIEVGQSEASPVTELHDQALAALDNEQYQQAIDYLQRAIKIQPRNAWSWHYLAQSYWHDAQFDRCLTMIARSLSYASYDDNLERVNDRLRAWCQQG